MALSPDARMQLRRLLDEHWAAAQDRTLDAGARQRWALYVEGKVAQLVLAERDRAAGPQASG